jgi:hypothetical protein
MTGQTRHASHPTLDAIAARAKDAGVFGEVSVTETRLSCSARDADAHYRVDRESDGVLWVSVVTADRWLSESIETELLHSGDKIEELLEDELIDQGFEQGALRVEHFRSDDLLFTFRSPLPTESLAAEKAVETAAICLLAYEACFSQLGDMGGEEED